MVTQLKDAGVEVKIHYVLVSGSVSKEDTSEVMMIKLALPGARPFNTNPSAKHLQMSDVGFLTVSCFIGGLIDGRVDEPIVKVNCMEKGCGPKLCGKSGTIK
jgi:hypothetical protein